MDVASTNVPFFIGLDIMNKYKMSVVYVRNILCCRELCMEVPLVRKQGHLFLGWGTNSQVLYTYSELQKKHEKFSHSHSDKLFNLLELALPWETNQSTRDILEDIRTIA